MNKIIARIMPFIFLGILVVVFALGIVFLSYLLILGAIVGFILFIIAWVKDKFFPSKTLTKTNHSIRQGRTFDHDDKL